MLIPDAPFDQADPRTGIRSLSGLIERRERGLRFLLSHLKPAGNGHGSFFHGPARSRALETALTLHVLRQARIEPAWQERLRGYLVDHAEDADEIGRLVAHAALGQARPDDVTGLLNTLTRDLEYGRRRKQALLLMLMVELGCLPLERARVELGDFAAQATHRFSQLYCAALRMIHRRHAGGGALDGGQDIALLESAAGRSGAQTRRDSIRALYGEDIPLATMMVAFGKPVISPDQVPPLLVGKMDCYWTQRPGYRMTERELRTMLYDHAYVRRTWRTDKTGRAEEALAFRRAWEEGPTLGLGIRLGPFWYPAKTTTPADEPGERDPS
jgi:hypothetical protein